jgi:hypothetical protein
MQDYKEYCSKISTIKDEFELAKKNYRLGKIRELKNKFDGIATELSKFDYLKRVNDK